MKYQLFTYGSGRAPQAGIVVGNAWLSLAGVADRTGQATLARSSVDDLLQRWETSQSALRRLANAVAEDAAVFSDAALDAAQLTLLAPLTRPGVIYAAGANYRDHVAAMSSAFNMKLVLDPKGVGIAPWHFLKGGAANLSGHRGEVAFPARTQRLDWEAELAVVIGRHASGVTVGSALDHVAGYMCANDLSARDHFVRDKADPSSPFRYDWIGHKSFNGSCPLGPVFTPAEFVGSPENLHIKLWVNGEIRQDSNTSNHLYNVAEQIAHLSERTDLYPGDVILTGTPAGVGMESGVFLKRGDVTKVWIDGLGELETRIV
ncbi:2-keto-4-pentenoate hydratase/2-oxohepta-3-ene-1,7-dioic acid hydratase (catechol pathway) [Variovorax sp. YR266]|uniref:fumarylacetoacetate hydrolase family protein n=1 Tax=Variovorax sp. YR266 TaxID=1884386 RepID=UPI00089A8F1D|nr:fumarylacetoacetate hydrolase family protein [Variovorax sp. YR266]SDZ71377.1 2-keto-4-pentenoate hydratase/2-oxohepta-3-ene-1,7-dioic acid hydratase (catechol pathway) [Variovorax sp. YR266]